MPSGFVAGFADATGHFLPLVCTLNAARVLTATADLLGVDFDELAALALAAEPGSGGLTLLPYLDGERTPNLPDARGSLHGMTRANLTPQNLARAAIEGMFGGLADAVDALVGVGRRAAADPAHRRRGREPRGRCASPRRCSAPRSSCRRRGSTWPTAPRARRPGCCRVRTTRRRGPAPGRARRSSYDPTPVPAVREAYAAARTALYSG